MLIPNLINGVSVQFGSDVVNDVNPRIFDALKQCVAPNIAPNHSLNVIYISSAYDSHQMPSRHMQHKAVDISRINGRKIAISYPSDPAVKAIVDAIQEKFEEYAFKRENFGPHIKRKLGASWYVAGHNDHIHLSVN